MNIRLAPKLTRKLKKQDVRTRKSFKIAINDFSKYPSNPRLNNHELVREREATNRATGERHEIEPENFQTVMEQFQPPVHKRI